MTYEELTAGVSEDSIQAIVRGADQRSWLGPYKIKASNIDGLGVFTVRPMAPGVELGPARLAGRRTPIGRYLNHSHEPNAEMVRKDNDLHVRVTKFIEKNREITVNYAQVLRVNLENPWI